MTDSVETGRRIVVAEVIPASAACLDGHFPDQPIVPGAILLGYAAQYLKAEGFEISGVSRMKFLKPLLPDQAFTIGVQIDHKSAKIMWRADDIVLAQARATLHCHDD